PRLIQILTGMLAAAALSGCVATDPSLSPTASPSPDLSTSGAFAMLPETVTVLPTPSGNEVAYAAPADIPASAFARSQPAAAGGGGQVFLEPETEMARPEPVSLSPRTRPLVWPEVPGGSDEVNQLIEKYAQFYDVPVQLVRRVVRRESNFNPAA